MSTEYDKIRDRAMENGFDDIDLIVIDPPHPIIYNTYPAPRPSEKTYVAAEKPEEEMFFQALSDILAVQEEVLRDLIQFKEPRSDSFLSCFGKIEGNFAQKERFISAHLSSSVYLDEKTNRSTSPEERERIADRLLEYIIKRILNNCLKNGAFDQTELINLIEDATYYISRVAAVEIKRSDFEGNALFVTYLKEHAKPFDLSVSKRTCCKYCGRDVFENIPYCLRCNSKIILK